MRIAGDAVQNLIGGAGPGEGFGVLVMDLNVLANGGFEFFHAAKDAAPKAFVGEFRKPAFHRLIQEPYVGVKWR